MYIHYVHGEQMRAPVLQMEPEHVIVCAAKRVLGNASEGRGSAGLHPGLEPVSQSVKQAFRKRLCARPRAKP